MRNKIYRPIKLWLTLLVAIIFSIVLILILSGWKQIVSIIILSGLLIFMPVLLTYYFKITNDSIIIRHGLSSYSKKYRSSFKTRIILIDEINGLDVRDSGRAIVINLKNGNEIYFPIGGYFNRNEIVRLVYDVKKQIY